MKAPPSVYVSLAPFREWFRSGLPILMYHKLGPRPRHVKLKGLYVSAQRFARQLAELRAAGYRSVSFDELPAALAQPERCIALTFDDAYVNVLVHGLPLLTRYGFSAIQYVVAEAIGGRNEWDAREGEAPEALMDRVQLREWLSAGQAIGSHGLSHVRLTQVPPARAREEIFASKKKLEDLFGVPVRHFCYPYGDWNPRVRDFAIEAGYASACTTAFGLNDAQTPPHELKRIQARYPSLSLRTLRQRLFG
ncbi:MAG: polysaccharide deacetylase family protein [Sinobacteraceae bacterium]|nr:polysaccharide deacetylase family protein [Nevskiaceae bacterium]